VVQPIMTMITQHSSNKQLFGNKLKQNYLLTYRYLWTK